MKRCFNITIILLSLIFAKTVAQDNTAALIPMPNSITTYNDNKVFTLNKKTTIKKTTKTILRLTAKTIKTIKKKWMSDLMLIVINIV